MGPSVLRPLGHQTGHWSSEKRRWWEVAVRERSTRHGVGAAGSGGRPQLSRGPLLLEPALSALRERGGVGGERPGLSRGRPGSRGAGKEAPGQPVLMAPRRPSCLMSGRCVQALNTLAVC